MSDNLNNTTPPPPSNQPPAGTPPINWEREVLEKLVFATLKEQRANRRWSIFFKVFLLIVVFFAIASYFDIHLGGDAESLGRHTALIEIEGNIENEGSGAASVVIPALNKAFADAGSVAVVLHINSPGGSPVQAGMIVDEIHRLRRGYPNKPLYVVVDEICASGGYYIAAAADRIYVNKASVIGSIGVLMDGFGFTGTMEKLGVERRAYTAGENKDFLDPFAPENPKQKEFAKQMLSEIHQQFIDTVKAGRGKRLKETPDMFSGLIWTGARSIELGLADELGSLDYVAREVIKAERVVDFTPDENYLEQFSKRLGAETGASFARSFAASLARGTSVGEH